MSHLPIERLAELVDESPAAPEREHLTACATCAAELEAYRRLVTLSVDERRRIAPPLTDWATLSDALRTEGLIAPSGVVRSVPAGINLLQSFRRAAAVVALIGGGAVLGRVSTGLPLADAVAIRSMAPVSSAVGPADVDAQLVSDERPEFASNADALSALQRAQRAYESAAAYLSMHDTTTSERAPEQYRTRLAALDRTAETMLEAMHEAPQDPLINQYLLATLGAREQTLQRLGTTLPVGNRLVRQ